MTLKVGDLQQMIINKGFCQVKQMPKIRMEMLCFLCVFFVLFSCFQMFQKNGEGVGEWGLINPSFSRFFGSFLT